MYILQMEVSETTPVSIHFRKTNTTIKQYMIFDDTGMVPKSDFAHISVLVSKSLFLWILSGFQVVISPISQFAARTHIFTWEIFISRREYVEHFGLRLLQVSNHDVSQAASLTVCVGTYVVKQISMITAYVYCGYLQISNSNQIHKNTAIVYN